MGLSLAQLPVLYIQLRVVQLILGGDLPRLQNAARASLGVCIIHSSCSHSRMILAADSTETSTLKPDPKP